MLTDGTVTVKKKRSKVWTYPEVDLVRKWQKEGVTWEEQGRLLGRSRRSVEYIVKKHKLDGNPAQLTYDYKLRSLVIELLGTKGWNQSQIQKHLGYKSTNSINRIFRQLRDDGLIRKESHHRYVLTEKWKKGA